VIGTPLPDSVFALPPTDGLQDMTARARRSGPRARGGGAPLDPGDLDDGRDAGSVVAT
jgi:hypothetical protein